MVWINYHHNNNNHNYNHNNNALDLFRGMHIREQ